MYYSKNGGESGKKMALSAPPPARADRGGTAVDFNIPTITARA